MKHPQEKLPSGDFDRSRSQPFPSLTIFLAFRSTVWSFWALLKGLLGDFLFFS